jgi:S1-C subfamily serine protease
MKEFTQKNLILTFLLVLPPIAFSQTALTTAQIAKRVSPSVVVIQGKTDSGDVLGSGFIVSKDGNIVTNLHVIRDMRTASVHIPNDQRDGGWTPVRGVFDSLSVLATDESKDLAVVKVSGSDLPVLNLGNSDALTVGEPVVIVGSPQNLEGTVTAGILSSVRDSGEDFKVLQTDAAVNPGNSGGPLVNNRGQAIGVVSFKLRSAEGLNFAVPINYVRGMLNTLHEPMSLEQMRQGLSVRPSTAHDTDGPSLKETLDWLKETIPLGTANLVVYAAKEGFTVSVNKQAKVWSLESCTAELGSVQTETTPDHPTWHPNIMSDRYTVRLGNLGQWAVLRDEIAGEDDHFISGDRWGYYLLLTSKVNDVYRVFTQSQPANTPPSSFTTDDVGIFFPDESIARRVAGAFQHASDLCRRKEPF